MKIDLNFLKKLFFFFSCPYLVILSVKRRYYMHRYETSITRFRKSLKNFKEIVKETMKSMQMK